MSYNYKPVSEILDELDPNRLPMVGPALCDTQEGDPYFNLPQNLNDYYIPFYKKFMGSGKKDYPKFFCELQPNTEFVGFDGKRNLNNRWPDLALKKNASVNCGLHFPLKAGFLGSLSERESEYTLANRRKVIDFGERAGVKYYTIHVSQDGFISNHDNYLSVKNILKKTIEYFAEKNTKAYILIENLEYPKYPATPQELAWWFNRVKEYDPSGRLKFGVVIDVAHLWRTRGEIIKTINEKRGVPAWVAEEKGIIFQPYHDLLNYALKTKLNGIPVITFHFSGSYGYETHLIPGMRPYEDPDTADIKINRFYDENVEMNLKNTIKTIVKYYFDSYRGISRLDDKSFRPLHIAVESYISYKRGVKQSISYPSVMKGVRAVRDYALQYFEKLNNKSENRVRVYNFLKKR